jgi:hypothetical protein
MDLQNYFNAIMPLFSPNSYHSNAITSGSEKGDDEETSRENFSLSTRRLLSEVGEKGALESSYESLNTS